MSRTRLVLAALGMSAALTGCGTSTPAVPSQDLGTELSGRVPAAIMSLPLTDSTGKVHHLADYAGDVVVIDPIMTLCQETCPLDTAAFTSAAHAAVSDRHIVFLSITIDPERDTVPQLAAYRKLYAGPPNWLTLTGSAKAIDAIWKYFGIYHQKVPEGNPPTRNWRTGAVLTYDIDHTDAVIFIGPDGQERWVVEGPPDAHGETLPAAMQSFLSAHGLQNWSNPDQPAWSARSVLTILSWLRGHQIKPLA